MSAASLAPDRLRVPALPYAWRAMIGVAAVAVAARLASGWAAPFGFDETFSGVIAAQPDPRALVDWCLNEVGGPVYYMLLWCWAQAFGTGVAALRAFSLLLSVAAPLAILRWGHPDRMVRLYWAALAALWLPALEPATSARCYALLMLETTAQAIAYRGLLAEPGRVRALVWTGLSAMAVLTHYHAAVLAGVQGLVLLATRPRAAVRCWPALIVLVPVAGWIAAHLPLLTRFAAGGAWYPVLDWSDLLLAPATFFESALIGYGAVLALGLGIVLPRYRLRGINRWDAAVALSGLVALALLLLIGMLRPSFAWRYTMMLGPAVLLGIAAAMRQAGRRAAIVPSLVVAVFAASAAGRIAREASGPGDVRYTLNLSRPSEWLVAHHATRLGFLWDSPTGRVSEASRLAQVVGFGPRRTGGPVQVTILPQPDGVAPSAIVARAIASRRIDSLLWLADAVVPGTRAMPDSAMMRRYGWRCADFGGRTIVMLACRAP